MRILMLGNSFTFYNDLPGTLALLTGAEVVHHTRGGAYLSEQLSPGSDLGRLTQSALRREKWDYVVLQEMSSAPITANARFLKVVSELCAQIRENGALPLLYATWPYRKDSAHLRDFGMEYEEMYHRLHDAYHEAAQRNHCLIADVGTLFFDRADDPALYDADCCHPSAEGSRIAAQALAQVILEDWRSRP